MDFELSDDQKMLRDTVTSFASKSSPVSRFRKLRDEGVGWSRETWAQMGDLGWLTVPFPETAGGFGGSFVDVALILEGFGKSLIPEPYVPSVVLGGMAVLFAGDSEQQRRLLTPMMEGKTSLALAHGERTNRFANDVVATRAESHDDGYRLAGEKTFVLNGAAADHIVTSAMTANGVGLFVIDRGADGLSTELVRSMDGHDMARLRLDGVKVGIENMLGTPGAATIEVIDRVADYGAAAACAEAVGICQVVLDMTVEYLKTREQFGVKIGTFQVLQHRAVDMFVEVELMRSASILASVKVGDADPAERRSAVSAAKAQVAESGRFVTQQSIQLHGGIGVTDEHDIGLYFKRMHALSTLFGDYEHHVQRFADQPSFAAGL